MSMQVGINVLEVDGLGSPGLVAAPTSVAGFVGIARRGVPHRPLRVSAIDQVVARTGAQRSDAYLGTALTGFFGNGGREAWVVRVVGAGSVPASATLTDRESPSAPCLRVSAGYRGEPDPGDWGEGLRLDVRDDPLADTVLGPLGAAVGATSAVLAAVTGVRVGSVLRLPTAPVSYRQVTAVDPASRTVTWAGGIAAAVNGGEKVATAEFRLVVRWLDPADGTFAVVEDWRNLSMQPTGRGFVGDVVNHPLTGSRFVRVDDVDGGVHPGVNLPAVVSGVTLDNGTEVAPTVADLVGDAARRTGLHALDTVAIQLLAVPDAHRLTAPDGPAQVARAATDWCAARGDCLYVGSPPDRAAPVGVVPRSAADYTETVAAYAGRITTYASTLQANKVYGALYAPWIVVADPGGAGPAPVRVVPPDGHVLGVYARTEGERGIAKAPAGDAALVRGATAAVAGFTQAQHTDLVRVGLTNGILAIPRKGLVLSASRTLSSDPRWTYVNVRLLFNFVKATLRDGLRFVRQEPHTPALRRSVAVNVVTPFLLGLWRQGAFGSDPPDLVFTVKCDAENNPPAQVDQGLFQLEVYFYAARPAETVRIVVGQQPGGGSAAEA